MYPGQRIKLQENPYLKTQQGNVKDHRVTSAPDVHVEGSSSEHHSSVKPENHFYPFLILSHHPFIYQVQSSLRLTCNSPSLFSQQPRAEI
ncbi:hypothetical protein U0070_020372 [Myodes glareolus]|uniref:Uncharacterized protein n=1 Tax=Myodes glareolus TaxID=447135 RepID=A0AAW0JVU6_MYOGA